MNILRHLFGRRWDGAAEAEKSGEAPPPASTASASVTATPAGLREAIVHALMKQLVKQSETDLTYDAIDPDAVMCDRGYIDSLTYVAFLVFVEETYGVRISDYQLTRSLRTVSAIADRILAESKSIS